MVTELRQQPASIAQATMVLANPSDHLHRPRIFMTAWAILKSARGQTMRQCTVTRQFQKLGDCCNQHVIAGATQ